MRKGKYEGIIREYGSIVNCINELKIKNLKKANLENADLENIRNKLIIRLDGIGSNKRQTIYNITDNHVQCGWFYGTFGEFIKQIKNTYRKGTQYYKEYKLAVLYLYKQANNLRRMK
jgi:hypothetical protein